MNEYMYSVKFTVTWVFKFKLLFYKTIWVSTKIKTASNDLQISPNSNIFFYGPPQYTLVPKQDKEDGDCNE